MTNDELTAAVASLREAESKMTPGEWTVAPVKDNDGRTYATSYETWVFVEPTICGLWAERGENLNDAHGIASLRNTAMPVIDALLARCKVLEDRIDSAMNYLPTDRSLTSTEAEIALELVEPMPLSEERIAEIVKYVTEQDTFAQEPTNG